MDADRGGNYRWLCECNCGTEKIILGSNLKRGHTKSCGCLLREGNNTTHGHSKKGKISKTYDSWHSMIQRCTNPNNIAYHDYCGRGITVCKRWLKFENFLEDMGEVPIGYSIDRIDNDGNYCKSNCRWSTRSEQQRNTTRNHMISFRGKTQCLAAWAEEFHINYSTLCSRIFIYGWSIKKALTTPVKKRRK